MWRTLFKIVLALLLVLVVLEIGLRRSGRYQTYSEASTGEFWFEYGVVRESPEYTYIPHDTFLMDNGEERWIFTTNSLGYRGPEIEEPEVHDTSNAPRVFVLGDSFVEGNGTAADSSWPKLLESQLQNVYPGARVYGCGISGTDPYYAYAMLRRKLLDLQPTHVISAVNGTDFNEYLFRGGFNRFQDGKAVYNDPPWFIGIYRRLHLFRAWVHTGRGYDIYLIDRRRESDWLPVVADSLVSCLDQTNDLCESENIKFLAVVHPVPHTVCYRNYNTYSYTKSMDLDDTDFRVVDLNDKLEVVLNPGNCSDYAWQFDNHFNHKGYEIFSDLVFEAIVEEYPRFWETD